MATRTLFQVLKPLAFFSNHTLGRKDENNGPELRFVIGPYSMDPEAYRQRRVDILTMILASSLLRFLTRAWLSEIEMPWLYRIGIWKMTNSRWLGGVSDRNRSFSPRECGTRTEAKARRRAGCRSPPSGQLWKERC
jgi:hypothetical protein